MKDKCFEKLMKDKFAFQTKLLRHQRATRAIRFWTTERQVICHLMYWRFEAKWTAGQRAIASAF
jgi:hypothetical protein